MTGIPTRPMELHWNGNCGAEFMGKEMGIKSSGMGILVFKEIPAPSDSYQINTVINYKHNKSAVSAQQYQMNNQCTLAVISQQCDRLHTA